MTADNSRSRTLPDALTLGFVGLGVMGEPMAKNLLGAGHRVVTFARRGTPTKLLAAGAVAAESPRDVARQTKIVLTMVSDDQAVREVVAGPEGLFSSESVGLVIVDMSTISASTAQDLHREAATHDMSFVDAPVSGGQRGAEQATLSIMAGGDADAFERVCPVLELLGTRVIRVGESGQGQVAKAANQVIVGVTIQAVAEALSLAVHAGADPAKVRLALLGGFAQSAVLDQHGLRMLEKSFAPGGRLALHLKDLRIAQQLAAEVGAQTPATDQVAEIMDQLVAAGYGDLDQSALVMRYGGLSTDELEKARQLSR